MSPLDKNDERYRNDAAFKSMVDTLQYAVQSLHLTPSEVREAAMYACYRIEMRSLPKQIVIENAADPKRQPGEAIKCSVCGDDMMAETYDSAEQQRAIANAFRKRP